MLIAEATLYCPSMFYIHLIQFRIVGGSEPTPAATEREAGNMLDWSPVHHRDKQEKPPCTLTFTPTNNLESPINLTCMFLVGQKKPGQDAFYHINIMRFNIKYYFVIRVDNSIYTGKDHKSKRCHWLLTKLLTLTPCPFH